MNLDGVVLSLGGGEGGVNVETSLQSVREVVRTFWKTIDPSLFLALCVVSLLCSRRLQNQAVKLERFLVCYWSFLLRKLVGLMPFHPQGNLPEREIGSLRRRVNSLDRLLRTSVETNRVQGAAKPAGGIPVLNTNRWKLLGSFIAGLWCGCVVSLLGLCIGVYIGHSL